MTLKGPADLVLYCGGSAEAADASGSLASRALVRQGWPPPSPTISGTGSVPDAACVPVRRRQQRRAGRRLPDAVTTHFFGRGDHGSTGSHIEDRESLQPPCQMSERLYEIKYHGRGDRISQMGCKLRSRCSYIAVTRSVSCEAVRLRGSVYRLPSPAPTPVKPAGVRRRLKNGFVLHRRRNHVLATNLLHIEPIRGLPHYRFPLHRS